METSMNAPERFFLPDIQASADHRQQAIDKVGVKGLRYPLALFDAQGQVQQTVAEVSMAVGLPPEVKGTHMSRFVELLEKKRPALTMERLLRMLDEMLRLAEEEASCEVYGLLKRPDRLLVRDIALRLKREPRIAAWTVKSENFESIHNHSAYAEISGSNGEAA
jgi:GTP cyclohydrolase FolE2